MISFGDARTVAMFVWVLPTYYLLAVAYFVGAMVGNRRFVLPIRAQNKYVLKITMYGFTGSYSD